MVTNDEENSMKPVMAREVQFDSLEICPEVQLA